MKWVVFFLLAAAWVDLSQAQMSTSPPPHRIYGSWVAGALGGGGYVQAVTPCMDRPNRLYAHVDVGGIWRSEDGGQTWRALHGTLPTDQGMVYYVRGVHVDPRNSDHVLIATGSRWHALGGIWRTTDGGESWSKVAQARFWANADGRQDGSIFASPPGEPDTVLVAGAGMNWISRDAGATWRRFGPDHHLATDLKYDPHHSHTLYLCAQPMHSWSQGEELRLQGGFFRSTDGGQSWQKLTEAGPREIAFDNTRIVGLFGGVVRGSSDRGETWTLLEKGLAMNPGATTEFDPGVSRAIGSGPGYLLLATGSGEVYRLPDGAEAWEHLPRERVVADDWWYGNTGDRPGWVHFGKAAASILVDPHHPNRWFMTDWYAIWRSEDHGKTWHLSVDGLECTVIHQTLPHPTTEQPDWIHVGMADNGYVRSENKGLLFRMHLVPTAQAQFASNCKQIVASPSNPRIFYALTNRQPGAYEMSSLSRSNNEGETWRATAMAGLPAGMGEKHVSCSFAVDPMNHQRIALALSGPIQPGAGGFYVSEDGADTFKQLNRGLPQDQAFFEHNLWETRPQIALGAQGVAIAISRVHRLVYRLDASQGPWQKVKELGAPPAGVWLDPHNPRRFYLAAGQAGLWVSHDAGQNWTQLTDQAVGSVGLDALVEGQLVIGLTSDVAISTNGGKDFRYLDNRLPYRMNPLVHVGHGVVSVGTSGNGIFVADLDQAIQHGRPFKQ